MKKINLANIDLTKLPQLNDSPHLESDLYHNDEIVYKIFKNFDEYKINKKQRKIELLRDGNSLPNVLMPIDNLYFNDTFFGYTMKYIMDSITLFNFNARSKDIKIFLQILTTISKSLKEMHQDPRDIIIGDLNFDNIILDKNYNPYFCDIDSCKINGLLNETNPAIVVSYLKNRRISNIDTNRNKDRLSLLLSTLYMIFKKHIDELSIYEFDKKAEHLETLRNIRNLILEIKKYQNIPEVPYIHELISPSDIETKKETIKINPRKRLQP